MRQLKENTNIRTTALKDIQRKIKYLCKLHSVIGHDSGDNFWADSFMEVQLSYGKIIVMSSDMEFAIDPYWELTEELPYFGDFNKYSTCKLNSIAYVLNTVDDSIRKTFSKQDIEFYESFQLLYTSAFKVARKAFYSGARHKVNFGKYTTSRFIIRDGIATYEILHNQSHEVLLSVKNGVIDLSDSMLINRTRGVHVFRNNIVNLVNARLVEDAMRF